MEVVVLILLILTIGLHESIIGKTVAIRHLQQSNENLDNLVPKVEALYPVGIRVSIDHVDGMEFFSFHGKINSPIRNSESGILSKDVKYPTNGQWLFEDYSVELKVGDIVNYWIFLQINGMGHRLDNLSSVIRELVHNTQIPNLSSRISSTRSTILTSAVKPNQISKPTNCTASLTTGNVRQQSFSSNVTKNTCSCDQICSQSRISTLTLQNSDTYALQTEVNDLKEVLYDLIKDKNVGTQLLLIGDQPPGSNPLEAIKQLIVEKLELVDLENRIRQAYQMEHGIIFDVTSPIDKLKILLKARQRLHNSSYQITDSHITVVIPNNNNQLIINKINIPETRITTPNLPTKVKSISNNTTSTGQIKLQADNRYNERSSTPQSHEKFENKQVEERVPPRPSRVKVDRNRRILTLY